MSFCNFSGSIFDIGELGFEACITPDNCKKRSSDDWNAQGYFMTCCVSELDGYIVHAIRHKSNRDPRDLKTDCVKEASEARILLLRF